MSKPKSPLTAVLVPSEHGSWAFVLEPVLLGTLVSGHWSGLIVVLAALLGFLAYRPLKLGLRDVLARKSYPRTRIGLGFGSLFLISSGILLILGPIQVVPQYWMAVGVFGLMGLAFAFFDARLSTGALGRELLGAVLTIPLAAAAFWISWNWTDNYPALSLSIVCLAKAIPTVLYVRARLRTREERGYMGTWAIGAGFLGMLAVGILEIAASGTSLFAIVYAVLAVRIIWGLSSHAKELAPKHVGMQEFAYSVFFLTSIAILSS